MNVSECLRDAAAYWERRRLVYNAVLVLLAMIGWGREIYAAGPRGWIGGGIILLVLAVLANLLYSAAYPLDLAFQLSPLRGFWLRTRWVVFTAGMVLASGLALWVMFRQGMA